MKTGSFVFLWIWPEPVRGSQSEENFQKTSLKAKKISQKLSVHCFIILYPQAFISPSLLNLFLLTFSSVSIMPTHFYLLKNFAVALSRYHPKLLSHSVCTLATNYSPPTFNFVLTNNLSTSPFGCSAPFIVIVFLATLPNDLTSSFVHSIMSAPYLETATA